MRRDIIRNHTAGRKTIAMVVSVVLTCVAVAALGCSTRAPLSDLASSGAKVGIRLTTTSGEDLRGDLVSMTADSVVVDVRYSSGVDVEIVQYGSGREVRVGGAVVPGEIVALDRQGGVRVAIVRRRLAAVDVSSATLHRGSAEALRATVLGGFLVGPLVGALLAALI